MDRIKLEPQNFNAKLCPFQTATQDITQCDNLIAHSPTLRHCSVSGDHTLNNTDSLCGGISVKGKHEG